MRPYGLFDHFGTRRDSKSGSRRTHAKKHLFLMVMLLILASQADGCGDTHVCVTPDCGPQEPPTNGQPQGPDWDIDGDSISNNTEQHAPNAIYGFRVDTADIDPSKSLGMPTAGSIDSAINLPDYGTMYTHYLSGDEPQTDDWGVLRLLNIIEGTGRRFEIPRGFAGTCREWTDWTATPRMQVGDLSQQHGGPFIVGNVQQHGSHQNGLDADVRYLRDVGEGPLNLREHDDSIHYDVYGTVDLMRCFMLEPRVEFILLDTVLTGIANDALSAGRLVHDTGHYNHFHVRVR